MPPRYTLDTQIKNSLQIAYSHANLEILGLYLLTRGMG